MKKLVFILGLILSLNSGVGAKETDNSIWNGIWEYQRYSKLSGTLEITNCKDNQCHFNIKTANGAHVCNIEGKLKTDADKAEYRERIETSESKNEDIIITFELNTDRKIIKVSANSFAHIYCGMQGDFLGEYENKNNPLRYNTGFDCWTKNQTDTERAICASPKLANASKEMVENYRFMQSVKWYKERDACRDNEICLWNFYTSSIKLGYEEKHNKTLNFYEYIGNISEDTVYYPTDFSLLTDFFIKNMPNEDYEEWTANFSQITVGKCEQCHYLQYGVAGLYTFRESVFYIDKNGIWLAFLHTSDNPQEGYIILYTFPDNTEKDIPSEFNDWLGRLKPYFPKGIKIKYFTEVKASK